MKPTRSKLIKVQARKYAGSFGMVGSEKQRAWIMTLKWVMGHEMGGR